MNAAFAGVALDRPYALWLAVLAILPLLAFGRRLSASPWLGAVPPDRLSALVDAGLRILGCIAIAALALGAAGLYLPGGSMQKIGRGAHLVLLVDRSSSMNDSFAGRTPSGREESKAAAAKRLLNGFAADRPQDRIGMAAFSTMPLFVLPLTDKRAAIEAAINAIDRPGLAYTDIGRGLAMAFSMFDRDDDPLASRAVVLVSDGAAVIDLRVQNLLRQALASRPLRLYWLFLRTAGSPGIGDIPEDPGRDTPQSMPERHLDIFFKSLGIPYRAFEAENAEGVAAAMQEIDKQERAPLLYIEHLPRRDLGGYVFGVAALALLGLLAAKLAERRIGPDLPRSADA
ncbi:MAG: vWA domain-containing protein [Pollutimonas bauzanensis]